MEYLILIFFFFLFIPFVVLGSVRSARPVRQTLFDGGLGISAAAGGAYAMKKLRDRKK